MNEFEIDGYIEKLASNKNVKSFYPIAICKTLKSPLKLIINRLNKLVDMGYLKLKFEIRCDNFDIIDIVDSYENYLGKQIECEDCDPVNEFVVGLENIFPIYYINNSYREYVKKKNICLEKKVYCNQVLTHDHESTPDDPISLKNILLENINVSSDSIEKIDNQLKEKNMMNKAKNAQVIISLINGIHQGYQYISPYVDPLIHYFTNLINTYLNR